MHRTGRSGPAGVHGRRSGMIPRARSPCCKSNDSRNDQLLSAGRPDHGPEGVGKRVAKPGVFSKYRQAVSYTAAAMGPAPVPEGELVLVRAGLRAGGWETCHVPRRTWLDSKIDVFLEELAASGMHLDRQRAGELITGQVRAVAALMAVTEATARSYLGDEIITDMARRMLFEVAGERPGADLLEAPRTVPLPLALVGITVAALAEAMQVRRPTSRPVTSGTSSPPTRRRCPGSGRSPLTPRRGRPATRRRSCSRRRCCAVPPGTSAAPPTWPRTAASSRTGFPRRHAASWPRPCAGMLTD